jgi:hypothetical protein
MPITASSGNRLNSAVTNSPMVPKPRTATRSPTSGRPSMMRFTAVSMFARKTASSMEISSGNGSRALRGGCEVAGMGMKGEHASADPLGIIGVPGGDYFTDTAVAIGERISKKTAHRRDLGVHGHLLGKVPTEDEHFGAGTDGRQAIGHQQLGFRRLGTVRRSMAVRHGFSNIRRYWFIR